MAVHHVTDTTTGKAAVRGDPTRGRTFAAPDQRESAPAVSPVAKLIDPTMTVQAIIAKYPATVRVLERHGLLSCGAKNCTLGQVPSFARAHHIDPTELMNDLEAAARDRMTAPGAETPTARLTAEAVTPDRLVADILTIPGALELLVARGVRPLRNAAMRVAFAHTVSLRQACRAHDLNLDSTIADLRSLAAAH